MISFRCVAVSRCGSRFGEGRWRVVDTGVGQASMRMKRGEAKLAIDESRLVILRAEK